MRIRLIYLSCIIFIIAHVPRPAFPRDERATAIAAVQKVASKIVRDEKTVGKPIVELRLTKGVVNQESIKSSILASVPIGSTKDDIDSFMKRCGIGKDEFSGIHSLKDGDLICRIGFDPSDGWIVHTHFGIVFRMNAQKRLQDVEVKRWLTGP